MARFGIENFYAQRWQVLRAEGARNFAIFPINLGKERCMAIEVDERFRPTGLLFCRL